jgi:hypothetical protein
MKVLLSICVTIFLLGLCAEGGYAQDAKVIAGPNFIGCKARETYQRLVAYAANHQTRVFQEGFGSAALAGECVMLPKGATVFLTGTAILHGLVKLHLRGSTVEYWTAMEAVADAPAGAP